MILEILAFGLIISACLTIFINEPIYSVISLMVTFILISSIYTLNGATFVAVFQLAIGVGTLAVLFLTGEMLSEKSVKKASKKDFLSIILVGLFLSLPATLLSISKQNDIPLDISFPQALWDLRAIDVVLQGLVIMIVALGIAIILNEKKVRKKID